MLAALDQPTGATEHLVERSAPFQRPGVLAMRDQAAVTLLSLLPTWADQLEAWRSAGREEGVPRSQLPTPPLLERLLEP